MPFRQQASGYQAGYIPLPAISIHITLLLKAGRPGADAILLRVLK